MATSAWEADTRPVQSCVVCDGEPQQAIALPRLPDVHRAFASSAICAACSSAAERGDVEELFQQAASGWIDDEDAALDVVRLVVAAAGHEPPPAQRPPRAPPPLSTADARIWRDLDPLVFGELAPDTTVRGVIEQVTDDEHARMDVWLAGRRARLSDGPDEPWLITDGVTTWRRSDGGMAAADYVDRRWAGRGSELAHHRSRDDVESFGFGQPVGPFRRVEYLGRAAWQFAFAAPPHKPFDMAVVVDAETGLLLERRFGDHSLARWTSFVTGEPVDPGAFHWDGPVVPAAQLRAAADREHEADMARRQEWFRANVTDQPIGPAGQPVRVLLHEWSGDGSFQASLDGALDGGLARRPRSATWWNLGWSNVTHRWSDSRWDWALSVWDPFDAGAFDQAALAELRRTLGSAPSSPGG